MNTQQTSHQTDAGIFHTMSIRSDFVLPINGCLETFCEMLPKKDVTLKALELQAGLLAYLLSRSVHKGNAEVIFPHGNNEDFLIFYARRVDIDPIQVLNIGIREISTKSIHKITRQQIAQNVKDRLEGYLAQDPDLKEKAISRVLSAAPKGMRLLSIATNQEGTDGDSANFRTPREDLTQPATYARVEPELDALIKEQNGPLKECLGGYQRPTAQLDMAGRPSLVYTTLRYGAQRNQNQFSIDQGKRKTVDQMTIEEGAAFVERESEIKRQRYN